MISLKGVSPIVSNRHLWLASGSLQRLALLRQIGIVPANVCMSNIDEHHKCQEPPKIYAARMAADKGNACVRTCAEHLPSGAVVLAADTVVAQGRRILPKPETRESANECLTLLTGRGHRVYTALWATIVPDVAPRTRLVMTRLKVKRLSRAETKAYLDSNVWRDKAGGLDMQGRAAAFVQSIIGSPSNVIGLPLFETATLLGGLGVVPMYPPHTKHNTEQNKRGM